MCVSQTWFGFEAYISNFSSRLIAFLISNNTHGFFYLVSHFLSCSIVVRPSLNFAKLILKNTKFGRYFKWLPFLLTYFSCNQKCGMKAFTNLTTNRHLIRQFSVDKKNKLKRKSKSMDATETKRSNFGRVEHLCVRFTCSYLHS